MYTITNSEHMYVVLYIRQIFLIQMKYCLQRICIIDKGNKEVKLTSYLHNRHSFKLINREVGCVHHKMFTLYTCKTHISWGVLKCRKLNICIDN